jgi:peptidoglycan hydrolase-like protein with peptidoglycan-binding domain
LEEVVKALRIVLVSLLALVLFGGTAYGAGLVMHHLERDDVPASASRAIDPSDDPSTEAPAPRAPVQVADGPTIKAKPPVLAPGDKGDKVRELQHRLFQMAWWGELTTGTYDDATRQAVAGFQEKRGLPATGVVDDRTWRRLVEMTRTPTEDQKNNVLHPGPTLLGPGATGEPVRDLQARLKQTAWYFGDVTGTYDAQTIEAVKGFQDKRAIPVTGEVDQRTLDRLHAMSSAPSYEEMHNVKPKPGALDPRCTTGEALCIDKSQNSLRYVVDGEVLATYEVRFGSEELPTREGEFSVYHKSRDHVSSLYDTPMPFAMFFSGGQAVHYSPDFAANGYNGASHGCVNVRDRAGIEWLFDQVDIGTTVIVYWSGS